MQSNGGRSWQGRRTAAFDEEEYDESSSMEASDSRERSSNSTVGDHRKGSVGPPPSYDGSKEIGVFEEYRIRAKLWLATTNLEGKSRGPRLMQALQGKAFESVKHLIDDSSWMDSSSNGEKLLEILSLPQYYGREEVEALYQAMSRLFYSELRKDEDDLPAFRSKFDQAVRKVKKHHVDLPQEALGFLFLKQSRLSGESLERLITLTGGDLKLDSVVEGIRRLKMRLFESEDSGSKKKTIWAQEPVPDEWDSIPTMDPVDEDEELSMLEEAVQELDLDESAASEISEESAKDILMTLIKQRVSGPSNLNYKQVQQQKKEVRNARGFKPVVAAPQNHGHPMRRDLQHLKSITKCKACGQVGHWHKECPTKNRSTSSNPSSSGTVSHGWWSLVQEEPLGESSMYRESDQSMHPSE